MRAGRGAGGQAEAVQLDVSQEAAFCAALEDVVKRHGKLDILVNNAGGSRPLTDADDEQLWAEAFALNFSAARRLTLTDEAAEAYVLADAVWLARALEAAARAPQPAPPATAGRSMPKRCHDIFFG